MVDGKRQIKEKNISDQYTALNEDLKRENKSLVERGGQNILYWFGHMERMRSGNRGNNFSVT